MLIVKNWSITSNFAKEPFKAPELKGNFLQGHVYGHSVYPDGAGVKTSRIIGVVDCGDYKVVKTKNSEYRVYPKDVDLGAEAAFPNYYERLKEMVSCPE